MVTYNAVEVIKYFKEKIGIKKSRKQDYIDQRNYVIAILYYEFKYIEEELAELFKVDRSTINHAKDLPYDHIKYSNEKFLNHTLEIREAFPYTLPEHNRDIAPERTYAVTVQLSKEDREIISIYASARSQHIQNALRDIVKEKITQLKK